MYFASALLLFSAVVFTYAYPYSENYDGPPMIGNKTNISWSEPYLVSIQQVLYNDYKEERLYHRCDGALIKENWVLSSAICNEPLKSDLYVIHADLYYNQTSKVEKIIFYPGLDYDEKSFPHIVLLKLESPILWVEKYVEFARLPISVKTTLQLVGLNATVNAFGVGKESGTIVSKGQYSSLLEVTIIDHKVCEEHVGALLHGPTPISRNKTFCAGQLEPGVAVCNAALGAPLVSNTNSPVGNFTLLGIFSWTLKPCAESTGVGVYINVAYYLDWILEQMRNQ